MTGSIRRAASRLVIGVYQKYVSQDYNAGNHARCMYTPSCSEYGRKVIEKDGLVRGGAEAALRMLSCTGEVRARHERSFYEALRTHTDEQLNAFVTATQPEAQNALRQLKTLTDRETELQRQDAPAAKLEAVRADRHRIMHEVELRQVDPPQYPKTEPFRFTLAPHRHAAAPSGHVGWLRRAVIGTAAVGGACLVGLAGAVAVGLLGTAVGPALGVTAGVGAMDRFHGYVARRFTPDALPGLKIVEDHTGVCGQAVHDFVARHGHSKILARILGVATGATTGLGVGIAAGLVFGGGVGVRMGAALGRNVAKDLLGVPR